MRRNRLGVIAAMLSLLGSTACDVYYNTIPGPDDLMHVVPWFDAMIQQPAIFPYQRADIPRNTVPGTVPVSGGEADWTAEWRVLNLATADRLVNPLAGQPATPVGDSLYHTFCAVCHGQVGAGDGKVGVQMAALSLLTDRAKALSDGYLYSIIRYGRGVMPRYGDKVHGVRRWEIVNYVRQLQSGTVAAAAPGGTN